MTPLDSIVTIQGIIAREVEAALVAERERLSAIHEAEKVQIREQAISYLEARGYVVVPPQEITGHRNGLPVSNPEKFATLRALVEAGASFSEIRRTIGTDMRTVKRYFPDYRPFLPGGGGDAAIIRQVNQDLQRIDKNGNMSTRSGRR